MIINGYKCAALAHNITGEVIGHEYFGTEKVVQDLEKMMGWDAGLILLKGGRCMIKDRNSGYIISLI